MVASRSQMERDLDRLLEALDENFDLWSSDFLEVVLLAGEEYGPDFTRIYLGRYDACKETWYEKPHSTEAKN